MAVMNRDINFLADKESVAVRQTRKGCVQEMMGCEAQTELWVTNTENKEDKYLYALEESSCMNRLICKGARPFNMNVSWPDATKPEDPKFAVYERPFRAQVSAFKCCCFQEIIASSGGAVIGSTIEQGIAENPKCVPRFSVKDATGAVKYHLHMETCCGGCCVNICAPGCNKCQIPFYLYDPAADEPGKHIGEITKVWGGMGKEMFSDADTFEIKYPPGCDGTTKANLLGTTFLINQLFFEGAQ